MPSRATSQAPRLAGNCGARGRHLAKPGPLQVGRQVPAVARVPPGGQCRPLPGLGDRRERLLRGLGVEQQAISVLQDEPAASAQGRAELAHHGSGFSQMLEDQPGMDQVEFARGHILALQVMAGDGEIGRGQAGQAADVDIGGQHRTAAGHLARQPCRYRPTARARLPAPPASG